MKERESGREEREGEEEWKGGGSEGWKRRQVSGARVEGERGEGREKGGEREGREDTKAYFTEDFNRSGQFSFTDLLIFLFLCGRLERRDVHMCMYARG